MAPGVIDGFEVIKVKHQHGQVFFIAFDAGHFLFGKLFDKVTVVQAGKLIMIA